MDRPVLDAVQWRHLWEEQTSAAQRRKITRAVSRGQTMQTPDEAAIATELAIRGARSLGFGALLALLVGATMLVALLALRDEEPSGIYWFWIAIGLVWLVVSPSMACFRMRRRLRAYRSNRTLSDRGY